MACVWSRNRSPSSRLVSDCHSPRHTEEIATSCSVPPYHSHHRFTFSVLRLRFCDQGHHLDWPCDSNQREKRTPCPNSPLKLEGDSKCSQGFRSIQRSARLWVGVLFHPSGPERWSRAKITHIQDLLFFEECLTHLSYRKILWLISNTVIGIYWSFHMYLFGSYTYNHTPY